MKTSFDKYCESANKVAIGLRDLREVVDRKLSGTLSDYNMGKVGCSYPWYQLQQVGLSKLDIPENYSGHFTLAISQGGLKTKNIPVKYVNLFKSEIIPAIKIFKPECGETFYLTLHFSEGLLLQIDLIYK